MLRPALVLHERTGTWARQLRPRLAGHPVRIVESRSTRDLLAAATGSACPIVLIDLASRPIDLLADLDALAEAAPNALVLVLDPGGRAEVAEFARERGATHVISGPAVPPAVVSWVERWLPLARRRSEGDGWSLDHRPSEEDAFYELATNTADPTSEPDLAPHPPHPRT